MLVTIGLSQGRGPSGEGVAGQLHQLDQQYQELARQQQLASALATTEAGSLDGQRAGWPNRSTRWHDRNNSSAIKFASPPRKPNERPDYSAKVPPPGRSRKEQGVATARRLELEALQERIISQQQTLKLLDGQIAARAIGGDQSVSVLAERMAAIAAQRATVVRQERLGLTAPIDGVVGDIAARAGQQIGASDVLLAVVPQQSKLEVELFAPSSVVGFVREGQQVRLMVNAFPYQKYGTIDGTVRWISSVPTQQAIPAAGKPQSELTFRIRVAIGSDQFRGSVPAGTLRAGMTLDGSLILENRRLWEVPFEPILKAFRR